MPRLHSSLSICRALLCTIHLYGELDMKLRWLGMPLNRLKNIPIRCPGIRTEPTGLLERFLSASDLSGIGVRSVLADLMQPMTILMVTADPVDQAPLRLLVTWTGE
jgi:hypothetical protein